MFQRPTFLQYAPNPNIVFDAHSIYFQVMGEHGFIGLGLFLLLGLLGWIRGQQVVKRCRNDPDRKWAADLAAMTQVSLIGYAVGGAFLGLAYFDLPYHIVIIMLLTAKFSGVLGDAPNGMEKGMGESLVHSAARWDGTSAWMRK